MPRKGTAEPDDLLKELPGAGEEGEGEGGEGNGSAAEVAVRGKGRTVADALKRAGLKGQAKDLKGKFNDLLKNPTNKITASRIFPRTLRGPEGKSYDCSEVVDLPPPLTLEEIIQHLHDEYGGKKWNVTVLDEDGEVIDRRNVDVPGEPKYHRKPEDDFQIPDLSDVMGEGDKDVPVEDPMDREIVQAEKQSRLLMVERQNAQLRAQLAEAKGEGHKKNGEVPVAEQIKAALAEQEARHRAEIAEREKKTEMVELERRVTSDADRRFNELKALIESVKAGNPAQGTALSDLGHKLEMLQTSIDTKIKDALSSYRDLTNTQIAALEKSTDSKLNSIITSINNLQNRPHEENPMKAMIPLITSSIERSTSGYKEMMGPLIQHMTAKQQMEAEPAANPLEETLETLGKFNLLGDRKSGDFGARVVDFAEKMGPEIMAFIREEKRAGREVTEGAIKNHLKLQAEKISREVSAAAAQEIRKIKQEQLGHQQQRPGLPAPAAPAQQQAPAGPSMVGRMSPEEIAARQKPNATAPVAPAPAPAAAPVVSTPAPAAPPRPAQAQVQPPPAPAPEPEEEPEEEEEDEDEGPELTVEEEMSARVNSTLSILEREMKIRPRQVTWPNAAWDDLPGPVLDQIIFSNDEEDVYNAIKPYADPELSDRVWALIRSNPQAKEFIVAGINLIKGWAIELQEKQRAAAGGGAAPAPEAPAGEGA